ncbi:MAG: YHYH protein, partial [Bacteroidota bacterium]
MNVFHLSLLSIFIIFACACDKDLSIDDVATDDDAICRTTEQGTFKINLDPNDCTINIEQQLNITSQYEEQIEGNTRQISVNGIASHKVGEFPSRGNPNTISSHNANLSMSTTPQLASNTTPASGYTLGVLFSGITIEPFTAEFYRTSTGGFNRDWNITTLTSAVNLGLDCNNAHVQPTGKYHYHGTPSAYIAQLEGNDGSQMLKIGYAGDGFPIYYKYGYDEDEAQIIALSSGYQLRAG